MPNPEIIPTEISTPLTTNDETYWIPSQNASWQIQLTGTIDTSQPFDIFFVDLFDTPSETIAELQTRGAHVVCYFSAGTFENWRPDANTFPAGLIGNALPDWPGESWIDIRGLETIGPVMLYRVSLAAQKGCDGIDPDNVDGYANDTGFPLTAADQLAYNIFLANAAHQNGLSVGLKNDLQQITQLAPFFDWALNEQCFSCQECNLLIPFINSGKAVFVIEYNLNPHDFCPQAIALKFNAIHKTIKLDSYITPCQ
jgi:hypothetical protein